MITAPSPPAGAMPLTGEGELAGLLIQIGHHLLEPDKAGQTIPIYVSGGLPVQGLNFNIQVADGGPEVPGGSTDGPAIQHVDILTGTIFGDNNTGSADADGAHADAFPQVEWRSTTTRSGTVPAEGLLAVVTIDTTGFDRGSWVLRISGTANGDTDFAGLAATLVDGSITIAHSWRNPRNPYDVNDDGLVSALDALVTINYVNSQLGVSALPVAPESPPPYYDVNGDEFCTAADVLNVVNYLNGSVPVSGEGEGSGEPAEPDSPASDLRPLTSGRPEGGDRLTHRLTDARTHRLTDPPAHRPTDAPTHRPRAAQFESPEFDEVEGWLSDICADVAQASSDSLTDIALLDLI
jgi:hypothetical protein